MAEKKSISRILYAQAFEQNPYREPRSAAYKAGVLAALEYREVCYRSDDADPCLPDNPYTPGTAESDAWYSGGEEGHKRWLGYLGRLADQLMRPE